jgi:hypothetical protein
MVEFFRPVEVDGISFAELPEPKVVLVLLREKSEVFTTQRGFPKKGPGVLEVREGIDPGAVLLRGV